MFGSKLATPTTWDDSFTIRMNPQWSCYSYAVPSKTNDVFSSARHGVTRASGSHVHRRQRSGAFTSPLPHPWSAGTVLRRPSDTRNLINRARADFCVLGTRFIYHTRSCALPFFISRFPRRGATIYRPWTAALNCIPYAISLTLILALTLTPTLTHTLSPTL